MKYYKKLNGERIYLSPMNPEDAEKYAEWFNDSAVTDGLGATPRVTSAAGEKEWLLANGQNTQFAIVLAETNELIGNCGVQEINQRCQCAEVGLFIGDAKNRGIGLGTETLCLLLWFCFNTLNLNSVMLKVFSFNAQAIKCYEKVGFKKIGARREAYYLNGKFYDEIYMDILKSEFLK